MPKPPSKLRGKGSLTDARKREVQIWSDGGGAISPKSGKLLKLGQLMLKLDKRSPPTPARLSSRGITRRGPWGALHKVDIRRKRVILYKFNDALGADTRKKGFFSTPRDWPRRVRLEGGEGGGSLVDKCRIG